MKLTVVRDANKGATAPKPSPEANLPRSTRQATVAGVAILAIAIVGLGAWGGVAPIAGAVVASGVFVATGENKTIQHLEGGVIKKILVHEGNIVEAGQTLVELDPTQPKAELRRLTLRHIRLSAEDAALQSEVRGADSISFSPELLEEERDPEVADTLAMQRLAFNARRNTLKTDVATATAGIRAVEDHLVGLHVQLENVRGQIKLIEEEIETKQELLTTGLVRKPEVQLLQRTQYSLEGEVGRILADTGDARERITRFEEQIIGSKRDALKKALDQLRDVRSELVDVNERIRSAKAILDRINITTPVRGVVVKTRFHTEGGVIEPGKAIMEILPLNDELIIEARIRPQDIDSVKYGEHAMVRLTALSQRVTPMVGGEVFYLSADTLADERKSQQLGPTDVYVVRVRLDSDEVSKLPAFRPTPGMPVEVYIKTSERTFLQYVFKPIQDSMARSFRER